MEQVIKQKNNKIASKLTTSLSLSNLLSTSLSIMILFLIASPMRAFADTTSSQNEYMPSVEQYPRMLDDLMTYFPQLETTLSTHLNDLANIFAGNYTIVSIVVLGFSLGVFYSVFASSFTYVLGSVSAVQLYNSKQNLKFSVYSTLMGLVPTLAIFVGVKIAFHPFNVVKATDMVYRLHNYAVFPFIIVALFMLIENRLRIGRHHESNKFNIEVIKDNTQMYNVISLMMAGIEPAPLMAFFLIFAYATYTTPIADILIITTSLGAIAGRYIIFTLFSVCRDLTLGLSYKIFKQKPVEVVISYIRILFCTILFLISFIILIMK